MSRLFFLTFVGYCRADEHIEKHIHESPRAMTVPLMILAGFSLIGGWIGWPEVFGGENRFEKFRDPVLKGELPETGEVNIAHHALLKEGLVMVASPVIAPLGIILAYLLYYSERIA